MARVITNADVQRGLQGNDNYWTYNALDCLLTREVFDVIHPRLSPDQGFIYGFERAMQAPAMCMMLRGVRVDEAARRKAQKQAANDLAAAEAKCNALIAPWWSKVEKRRVKGDCTDGSNHKFPRASCEHGTCSVCGVARMVGVAFNPGSHVQCKQLLYETMALPPQLNKERKVSTDDGCLEKLLGSSKISELAREVVGAIQDARGHAKQLGFLKAKVSADGRMQSSFNVGTPETGRWSSSSNPYGEGTNLQNIAEKNRHIFVADPGMEIFYADLSQAESYFVACLSGDEAYIAAHALGDPHTYVSRMLWPDLEWSGDLERDKELAEKLTPAWDPEHTYRFQAKRVQHGSNYGLTPFGIAIQAHIKVKDAEEMQARYFEVFPGIREWQQTVVKQVVEQRFLVSPLRRYRQFFGRVWDRHTQRQGLAFLPQSGVAEVLNIGLYRVWSVLDTTLALDRAPSTRDPNRAWLLAQVHDAILGELRAGDAPTLQEVLALMQVPVRVRDIRGQERTMTIKVDCKWGKSWGKQDMRHFDA